MTAAAPASCGLYGKSLANADFIHRDLPRSFVEPWDNWLRGAMAASREALGESWMATYLKSPPWRFAIDAGLAGPSAWTGVLVSSIDHVKRYYPLTLAAGLPPAMKLSRIGADLDPLLEQIENIALCLVAGDGTVDQAMEDMPGIAREIERRARSRPPVLRSRDRRASVRTEHPAAPSIGAMIADAMPDAASGVSCWWHRGWGGRRATQVVAAGLPSPDGFAAFLDANWAAHGWSPDA